MPSTQSKEEPSRQHPLFNNSIFTVHRLSPLYLGSSSTISHGNTRSTSTSGFTSRSRPSPLPSEEFLTLHAGRFEDIIRGDVVRGVRVGFYLDSGAYDGGGGDGSRGINGATGRDGALLECRWLAYDGEQEERRAKGQRAKERANRAGNSQRGIHVEVVYEKAVYHAFMLRDDSLAGQDEKDVDAGLPEERTSNKNKRSEQRTKKTKSDMDQMANLKLSEIADQGRSDGEFLSLPLLLTKMPSGMATTLMDYLQTNFDARVSRLRLSSSSPSTTLDGTNGMGIGELLEGYISDIINPSSSPSSATSSSAFSLSRIEDAEEADFEPESNDPERNDDDTQASTRRAAKVRRKRKRQLNLIKEIVQEIHFIFAFPPPIAPALKSLNVSIPKRDLGMFLARGRIFHGLQQRDHRGSGRLPQNGQHVRDSTGSSPSKGLTGAVFEYLSQHLSLDPTTTLPLPSSLSTSSDASTSASASTAVPSSTQPLTSTPTSTSLPTQKGPTSSTDNNPSTTITPSNQPHDSNTNNSNDPTNRRPNKPDISSKSSARDTKLSITMSKISCPAFVLWGDGRVKINTPFQYLVGHEDGDGSNRGREDAEGDTRMDTTAGASIGGGGDDREDGEEEEDELTPKHISTAHLRATNGLIRGLIQRAKGGMISGR